MVTMRRDEGSPPSVIPCYQRPIKDSTEPVVSLVSFVWTLRKIPAGHSWCSPSYLVLAHRWWAFRSLSPWNLVKCRFWFKKSWILFHAQNPKVMPENTFLSQNLYRHSITESVLLARGIWEMYTFRGLWTFSGWCLWVYPVMHRKFNTA